MERALNDAPSDPAPAGFRRLVSEFTLFSVGGLAGKFIGILLLPVLARLLTTTQLGRFDVLSTLTSVLISALLLGLDVSALRLYFDEVAEATRRRLIGSWLLLLATTTVLTAGGIVLARASISSALFGTDRYGTAVALAAVAHAGGSVHYFALTVCRMRGRVSTFTRLTVGSLALYGILSVALILGWERSATAAIAGLAISWAVAGVSGLWVVVRLGIARPSARLVRRIGRIGLPLAPGVIALWGAEFAHRAILLTRADASQVAYFSVAVRFGSVGVLAATALQFAWHPRAFRVAAEPQAPSTLAKEARQIAMCVAALAVAVGVVAPEALRIVAGSDYAAATATVGWSCVYALFFGLFQIASLPSAVDRQLGGVGLANGVGAGLAVLGTVLFARRFGATGVMAAIAAGTALSCAVVTWSSRGRRTIPLPWRPVLAVAATTVAIVLAATLPSGGAPPLVRAVLAGLMVAVLAVEGSVRQVLAHWRPSPS